MLNCKEWEDDIYRTQEIFGREKFWQTVLELGDIPVLYRYDDILFTPVSISSLNFYIEKPEYRRIPAYRKIPIQISILVL